MTLRIIAGIHKGRRIETKPDQSIRPTSGMARAAIFNILTHGDFGDTSPLIEGKVADLFCGSGALGLEALSRGAAHVIFVDQSPDALQLVRGNLERYGELPKSRVVRSDSSSLPRAPHACTLVFLDPPYDSKLTTKALGSLARQGWLEPGAIIVAETGRKEDLIPPDGYTLFDERQYGNSKIHFLKYQPV